jgi:hypothetical protein
MVGIAAQVIDINYCKRKVVYMYNRSNIKDVKKMSKNTLEEIMRKENYNERVIKE